MKTQRKGSKVYVQELDHSIFCEAEKSPRLMITKFRFYQLTKLPLSYQMDVLIDDH